MADKFVTQREFDIVRGQWNQLRKADQRALEIKQAADDKATLLEQAERSYKYAQQNEWRGESSDRAATYATQVALEGAVATIMAKVDPVLAFVESQKGRSAGISTLQATLMGLAMLTIAALSVALMLAR
jgi:hypothetical protein